MWFISLGVIFVVVFGQYNIQSPDREEIRLVSAIYESLSRIAWSIALSWVIFACVKGYGGIINLFLSHSYWQPIARLQFSIYLLHLVMQYLLAKSVQSVQFFSDWRSVHTFWGDFGMTLTVSVFWTLAFESPIPILERFIFGLAGTIGIRRILLQIR